MPETTEIHQLKTQNFLTHIWSWRLCLAIKGILHQKNLSSKSHILDSHGVCYSSYWSEGPKNHLNLKIIVSKYDGQGPRGATQGFRGSATSYCFLQFSYKKNINLLPTSTIWLILNWKNLKSCPDCWYREEARKSKHTINKPKKWSK